MSSPGRVLLLAGSGDATNVVYNALASSFDVRNVIIEAPVPRSELLRRRARRLGLRTVLGQVAFMSTVVPLLERRSARRAAEIDRQFGLDRRPIPEELVTRVRSVNDAGARELIGAAAPSVVVVQGTRILSRDLLDSIACPVINMHAGITPRYRGVHGGYWALASKDPAHCGVTVHLVDAGIDTGGVLFQGLIEPTADDCYTTYPRLQLAVGIGLLRRAVEAAIAGNLEARKGASDRSRLWSHPTLTQYVWNRVMRGVR